ncbi:hypothetical protein PPS11_28118 [Pseudomonas putida S11]|nr:hypothetical protein PPS11_28118 [Pseudomonas putida S11]
MVLSTSSRSSRICRQRSVGHQALVGQAQLARGAVQQAHGHARLQASDALAHRRARQAQGGGGGGKTAGPRGADEGGDVAEAVGFHGWFLGLVRLV